ncbi:hypothetical protein PCANC_09622 [Puccinia coronata f. sp. avenae]|uniref:DNA damage-inducible protein 1 n=1 Tax=Puccinia coronata f. sp. avenae TaxID=200324 RepID=A0A2N5V1M4_9BASI|nr:hypothetical protein PCANC_09622 [Puccinia coronata f. sp. avenae]
MHLTFIIDGQEDPFGIDVDSSITIEDLSGLIEIELRIPSLEQQIFLRGTRLQHPSHTSLADCGITTDEIMELKRAKPSSYSQQNSLHSRTPPIAGGNIANDIDRMRLQMLGDPALMAQLRSSNPELANAAERSPERFAELMRAFQQEQQTNARRRRQDEELLHSDPFDIEAQRRIEEHIRQERVWENMQHAIEFSPESFGRVTMLYVDVEVNGHPVKAFVDSGAQMTIMSPNCAQATGIMRLIDERFSGIARGVGTAKILGRVHSAQMKISDLHLPCSFTIMEGKGVDLLFGLDMLKRHQAIIDLSKNALIIQGKEVRFLSEHELPESAKDSAHEGEETSTETEGTSKKGSLLLEDNSQRVIADTANRSASKPASTSRLGSNSGLDADKKAKVETLVGFGADPIQAEALLRSTEWNYQSQPSLELNPLSTNSRTLNEPTAQEEKHHKISHSSYHRTTAHSHASNAVTEPLTEEALQRHLRSDRISSGHRGETPAGGPVDVGRSPRPTEGSRTRWEAGESKDDELASLVESINQQNELRSQMLIDLLGQLNEGIQEHYREAEAETAMVRDIGRARQRDLRELAGEECGGSQFNTRLTNTRTLASPATLVTRQGTPFSPALESIAHLTIPSPGPSTAANMTCNLRQASVAASLQAHALIDNIRAAASRATSIRASQARGPSIAQAQSNGAGGEQDAGKSHPPSVAGTVKACSAAGTLHAGSTAGPAPSAAASLHSPSHAPSNRAPSAAASIRQPSREPSIRAPSAAASTRQPSRAPSVAVAPSVQQPSRAPSNLAPSVAGTARQPSCAPSNRVLSSVAASIRQPSCAPSNRVPSVAGTVRQPSCAPSNRTRSVAASGVQHSGAGSVAQPSRAPSLQEALAAADSYHSSGAASQAGSGARTVQDASVAGSVKSGAGSALAPSAAGSVKEPSATVSVKPPSIAASAKPPSIAASAKAPSIAASAKAPSIAASVKAPSIAASPKAPSIAASVKAPSIGASAKAPSIAASAKASSIAGSVASGTSAAGTAKAPSVAGTARAPSIAGTARAPTIAGSVRQGTAAGSVVAPSQAADEEEQHASVDPPDEVAAEGAGEDGGAHEDPVADPPADEEGPPPNEDDNPPPKSTHAPTVVGTLAGEIVGGEGSGDGPDQIIVDDEQDGDKGLMRSPRPKILTTAVNPLGEWIRFGRAGFKFHILQANPDPVNLTSPPAKSSSSP